SWVSQTILSGNRRLTPTRFLFSVFFCLHPLRPFHFKVDTFSQAGGAGEQGKQGEQFLSELHQDFREMVLQS
ncbi:MAG: hypothetical protein PUP93_04040, partial [Rhizonema sp. NSF051]|nr:hypothetical protein [Rhizonema sp. NSF051]